MGYLWDTHGAVRKEQVGTDGKESQVIYCYRYHRVGDGGYCYLIASRTGKHGQLGSPLLRGVSELGTPGSVDEGPEDRCLGI